MRKLNVWLAALCMALLCAVPALAWESVCEVTMDEPLAEEEITAEEALATAEQGMKGEGLNPDDWTVTGLFHEQDLWGVKGVRGWYVLATCPAPADGSGAETVPQEQVRELYLRGDDGTVLSAQTSPEYIEEVGWVLENHKLYVATKRAEAEKGPIAFWSLADKKAFYDAWPITGFTLDVLGEGDVTEEQALIIARGALRQAGLDVAELENRVPVYWCQVEEDGSRTLSVQFATTDLSDVNYGVTLELPNGRVLVADPVHGNG